MEIRYAVIIWAFISNTHGFLPDEGKWDENLGSGGIRCLDKSLYKGAQIFVRINCEANTSQSKVTSNIAILQSLCWDARDTCEDVVDALLTYNPAINTSKVEYHHVETFSCNDNIFLKESDHTDTPLHESTKPIHITAHDGIYILSMGFNTSDTIGTKVGIHIEIKNEYGYLSATDWPLLPFYGLMCLFYIVLGIIWLVLSFMQWRDLLRVQFWIGGVILLGMLEKATFYAEYQSINNTGLRVEGAMLFAEWVSCAKRTLARMLVIIVSLGFGIVKPRLGATLHRVVGVGLLYFFLAASEAYLRITTKNSPSTSRKLLVASVPLAVLDSAICWWIFSALVTTTRTLRLRRNETKLSLYRHFSNTLIFSVVASVFFMMYCINAHHIVKCLIVWKDLWLEDAYWHILFSCLLLVIMILWRPSNNNQRYAFVPLLDTTDDADEEEQLVNDAYGVKVRVHKQNSQSPRSSVDDDLKWLEENVKNDASLPILDSDDELVNTRFEVSKMQ